MVRFLIRVAIFLASAALGLLVSWWLLPGFDINWAGFIVAMLVFAIAQSLLSPLISKLAARHAPTILGGVGLVSTFLALGTWLLPLMFLKDRVGERREADNDRV